MDTAKVSFYFEAEEEVNLTEVAQTIKERVKELEIVQNASAIPDKPRLTGAEIAAGIALTVVIVRGVREVTEELNKLIPEIKKLVQEIKGLKQASVEVGLDNVSVDEMDEEKLQELAQEMTS